MPFQPPNQQCQSTEGTWQKENLREWLIQVLLEMAIKTNKEIDAWLLACPVFPVFFVLSGKFMYFLKMFCISCIFG